MAQVSFFNTGGVKYGVSIEGIEALKAFDELPTRIQTAARMTVNKAADRARTAGAVRIKQEVAFPGTYLDPSQGRLNVTKYATGLDLSAKITARDRPTSLARFITAGGRKPFVKGVSVGVKPGRSRELNSAFIFPLRGGNVGLAVRSKTRPANAYLPKFLGRDTWLLYAPSVEQVFTEVRTEIAPDISDFMESEFNRIVDLKL